MLSNDSRPRPAAGTPGAARDAVIVEPTGIDAALKSTCYDTACAAVSMMSGRWRRRDLLGLYELRLGPLLIGVAFARFSLPGAALPFFAMSPLYR